MVGIDLEMSQARYLLPRGFATIAEAVSEYFMWLTEDRVGRDERDDAPLAAPGADDSTTNDVP